MSPSFELLLQRYAQALDMLDAAETLTPAGVLTVFEVRSQLQQQLAETLPAADRLAELLLLDERLRQQAQPIAQAVDLATWRLSVNPPVEAWWWFLDQETTAPPTKFLQGYAVEVELLSSAIAAGADEKTLTQRILSVLLARDALQSQLGQPELPVAILVKVNQLDEQFRQQFELIAQKTHPQRLVRALDELGDIRNILNPPLASWWWFSKINIHWWDRLDAVWNTLTIVCLALSFSLLTDISSRFLAEGSSSLGNFAVIAQTLLALIGGGSLTKPGQRLIERTLRGLRLPKHYWQEARFIGAALLLIVFISFKASLPIFARAYNNIGYWQYEKQDDLSGAATNYRRALAMSPSYTRAHYNLGVLYEDLQDFESAREHYLIALRSGDIAAYNNFARLEVLAGNSETAVALLRAKVTPQTLSQIDAAKTRHDLQKNLGWALLEQGFYEEAMRYLRQAIETDPDQPSSRCLLAKAQTQRLEAQADSLTENQALSAAWERCQRVFIQKKQAIDADESVIEVLTPEEYDWYYEAKRRMSSPDL
ncbi:MAG: tetratricopeptide repeat protein [Leptolyngbya sp. SIO4C1]|nr:tetratricopeptide repeat protein [Leptolyngbya sp. SIO4C1]